MKRVVIDTNALISFVTDRSPEQQGKIAGVFEAASDSSIAILCHQQVLTEFVYVMDKVYRVEKREIQAMLRDLNAMPGVEIVNDLDMKILPAFWPEPFPDFADAVLAAFCRSRKDASLLSFDAEFIKSARNAGIKVYSF